MNSRSNSSVRPFHWPSIEHEQKAIWEESSKFNQILHSKDAEISLLSKSIENAKIVKSVKDQGVIDWIKSIENQAAEDQLDLLRKSIHF